MRQKRFVGETLCSSECFLWRNSWRPTFNSIIYWFCRSDWSRGKAWCPDTLVTNTWLWKVASRLLNRLLSTPFLVSPLITSTVQGPKHFFAVYWDLFRMNWVLARSCPFYVVQLWDCIEVRSAWVHLIYDEKRILDRRPWLNKSH